jgi:coiled-coil domain-containing protein 15
MQSSDRAHLTPKRTSVFPSNLNAAIGSFRLPHSQMVGDVVEDGENQNKLFQQAQAVSTYSFYFMSDFLPPPHPVN